MQSKWVGTVRRIIKLPRTLKQRVDSGLAVCLVSGGMDSCVTAAIAKRDAEHLAFLHISYGQRTEARERRAFEDIADHYDVEERLVVSLEQLAKIGGSSLTDKICHHKRKPLRSEYS